MEQKEVISDDVSTSTLLSEIVGSGEINFRIKIVDDESNENELEIKDSKDSEKETKDSKDSENEIKDSKDGENEIKDIKDSEKEIKDLKDSENEIKDIKDSEKEIKDLEENIKSKSNEKVENKSQDKEKDVTGEDEKKNQVSEEKNKIEEELVETGDKVGIFVENDLWTDGALKWYSEKIHKNDDKVKLICVHQFNCVFKIKENGMIEIENELSNSSGKLMAYRELCMKIAKKCKLLNLNYEVLFKKVVSGENEGKTILRVVNEYKLDYIIIGVEQKESNHKIIKTVKQSHVLKYCQIPVVTVPYVLHVAK